jgi:hypothetical protein
MATTFTKIASVSVGVLGAATIDFTSIPSTYTDLVLKTSCRDISIQSENWIYATFNGDSGSNYTDLILRGNGSNAASGKVTGTTSAFLGQTQGTATTANTFTNSEAYIPNYAGSAQKSMSVDTVEENNGTANYMALNAVLWTGTAAITSITLTSASGSNFAQYSTATLYGVSKS